MNNAMSIHSEDCQRSIRVRGIVQGVGFRPAVWRYANALGLSGYVLNDGKGVIIECRGAERKINQLIEQLQKAPPAQARISEITKQTSRADINSTDFVIAESATNTGSHTSISPDLGTCRLCLADIQDVDNRRYHYPFTNCTHCGPRLSILQSLPYDRANTSMVSFRQCLACSAEYEDPEDRRFHAQPNACPVCGPQLWLVDSEGTEIQCRDAIAATIARLKAGRLVALKGIGGFQLVVDAENTRAVQNLRERKQRPHKPFALMARDLQVIEKYCHISDTERTLLESAAAPIVLLTRRAGSQSTCSSLQPTLEPLTSVASGQNRLGFMLPTSPLHHLLLADFDSPLVMTSGNSSGEPQCIGNDKVLQKLTSVADVFLLHDRDILHRVDDSVVQVVNNQPQLLRRARGYAPAPLNLPEGFTNGPNVLAMGAELKNTFCLLRDGIAVLSQHIGDLQDAVTLADFEHNLALYSDIYQHHPAAIAVDQHPQYLSSQVGQRLAEQQGVPLLEVQHHHAHIAACLGDNLRPLAAGPVLGVALDGLGYSYGSIENSSSSGAELWGGEIILADYRHATRLARLRPMALPGGNIAMRQPWRNCLAQLHSALGWQQVIREYAELPLVQSIARQPVDTLTAMIDKGINSPLSSSCGRLFDAVAAALAFSQHGEISFEGQAPMAMEASIDASAWRQAKVWPMQLTELNRSGEERALLEMDPAPLWVALLDDLARGCPREIMAASFYKSLVAVLAKVLQLMAKRYQISTVALSGGCFQSPRLQSALKSKLVSSGFDVLTHHQVPANDGGLCFGQALIAAAQMQTGSHSVTNVSA